MENGKTVTRNEALPVDKDGLIWHFTTLDALPKILLEADGLLAGHTSFMNDPTDCAISNRFREVMLDLFCVAIHHLIPNTVVPDNTIKIVARQLGIGADISTFIVCFSPSLNNRKRWKSLTEKGGVAIGFNAFKLYDALKTDLFVTTRSCDYDLYTKLSKRLDSIKQKALRLSEQLNRESNPAKRTEVLSGIGLLLREMEPVARDLVFTKRPKYRWEDEVRAACIFKNEIPENRLRFLDGKPYVTLNLPMHIRNYVDRIVASPCGNTVKSEIIASFVGKSIGLEVGGRTNEGLFFMEKSHV